MTRKGRNGRFAQHRSAATPVTGERIALYMDLENLLYEYRQAQDWDGAIVAVASLVHGLATRGTLVARVAFADTGLVRRLTFALGRLGVRSHAHMGGQDGADTSEHPAPAAAASGLAFSFSHHLSVVPLSPQEHNPARPAGDLPPGFEHRRSQERVG